MKASKSHKNIVLKPLSQKAKKAVYTEVEIALQTMA